MARINLTAATSKGQTPFARREAEVERDGDNVFLSFPAVSGVVSSESAVALGNAILTAAGVAPSTASASVAAGIPAGWSLRNHDGGFVITDAGGVVRGSFKPVTLYQSA